MLSSPFAIRSFLPSLMMPSRSFVASWKESQSVKSSTLEGLEKWEGHGTAARVETKR